MAKHALLSASGAHRWLLCTPSAQLEQKFPASTSAYAEEGTVAHALAELTTRYFLGELDEVAYENQIKSEFEPNSYYNAEMRECAVAYAKFVTGRLAEAKKTCPDAMIILETRLDFSKYVPGGFGTGDCVIIAEPILDVIDFKYGKGHRVEAEDNPQMQLYGLGALEQFGDLYEIKTVRMTIFQPRLSGIEDSSEKPSKSLPLGARAMSSREPSSQTRAKATSRRAKKPAVSAVQRISAAPVPKRTSSSLTRVLTRCSSLPKRQARFLPSLRILKLGSRTCASLCLAR